MERRRIARIDGSRVFRRWVGRKKSRQSFISRVSLVYITAKCFDIALGLDCTGNTCRRYPPLTWRLLHYSSARSLLSTLSFLCRLSYIDRSCVTGVKFVRKARIDRALHHRPLFRRAANKLIVRHNVSGVRRGCARVKTRGRVPTCGADNKCSLYGVIYRFL